MTPLRLRLIEEITLRGYSRKTCEAYVHAVAGLAVHYHRSPETLSDEEIRQYLLCQHTQTNKAASTLNVLVSGLRFFYQRVLGRPFYPRVEGVAAHERKSRDTGAGARKKRGNTAHCKR